MHRDRHMPTQIHTRMAHTHMYTNTHVYRLFYCAQQILLFFFLNRLKVCSNPASNKSIGAIFPKVPAYFGSLAHVLVSLTIFQTPHQQKRLQLPGGSEDG